MVAGGNHHPGEASNRRAEDEGHPCAENLLISTEAIISGHLVDQTTHETPNDVADEKSARDPRADMEVDLNGIARYGAVHHLGNGHT